MKLYSYWRSSSSWRVRIALHHKGIPFGYHGVDLVQGGGAQHRPEFRSLNPLGRVPCLQFDYEGRQVTLSESIAILEFLEEVQPDPPLLPSDLFLRAKARQMAQIFNSSMQPLQNLLVAQEVEKLGISRQLWSKRWMERLLPAVETEAAAFGGSCMVGNLPSHADLCLVPQLYAARRFEVDLSPFPTLLRVEAHLQELPAFVMAHADQQPDAVST